MRRPAPVLLAAAAVVAGTAAQASGYRWVEPPAGEEATAAPVARTLEVPASASAIAPTEVWVGDLQVVVDLDETPLPERADRTGVAVAMTPHGAGGLATLPEDEAPVGNAYEVRITDGDAEVDDVVGRIHLTTAAPADGVRFSADGSEWSAAVVEEAIPSEVTATLAGPGFYLPVSVAEPEDDGGGGVSPFWLLLVVLGGAGAAFAQHRRRR